jgi:hypothetical protein
VLLCDQQSDRKAMVSFSLTASLLVATATLGSLEGAAAFSSAPRPKFCRTALSAKKADDSSDKNSIAKKAALDGVLQQIERSYGRGSIVKLGDADNMVVRGISSGALTLGTYSSSYPMILLSSQACGLS